MKNDNYSVEDSTPGKPRTNIDMERAPFEHYQLYCSFLRRESGGYHSEAERLLVVQKSIYAAGGTVGLEVVTPPPDPAAVGLDVTAEIDAALLPPLLGLSVTKEVVAAVLPPILGLCVATELAAPGLGVTSELVDELPAVLGLSVPPAAPVPPADGIDVPPILNSDVGLSVPPEPAAGVGLDELVSDGLVVSPEPAADDGLDVTSDSNVEGEIVGH